VALDFKCVFFKNGKSVNVCCKVHIFKMKINNPHNLTNELKVSVFRTECNTMSHLAIWHMAPSLFKLSHTSD
jgi:hypothetical protein